MNQFRHRARVKAEFFVRHRGQQFGARLVRGVVKLVAGAVLAEMFGVLGSEESALVVVEPPGAPRRARVLEVRNSVFIAVEDAFLPGLRGAMRHSGEVEFRPGMNLLPVEAVEKRRRGGAVKAAIVEAQPNLAHPKRIPGRSEERRVGKE